MCPGSVFDCVDVGRLLSGAGMVRFIVRGMWCCGCNSI